MSRYLGYQGTHWNALSDHDNSRRHVERTIYRLLHRDWMPLLTGNQYKVFSFILGRTLGWQKYAEAIPMSHFLHGMTEADGTPFQLENGQYACLGTGIKKEDTVREAISVLRENHYITVFSGKRGTVTPANVYMPMAEHDLAITVLEGEAKILPEHLPLFYPGEHVLFDRQVHRIIDAGRDTVRILEVSRYGDPVTDRSVIVSNNDITRMRPDEWKKFTKREN